MFRFLKKAQHESCFHGKSPEKLLSKKETAFKDAIIDNPNHIGGKTELLDVLLNCSKQEQVTVTDDVSN